MTKRILALLLTLALVLPAVSCDVLLADPNGPGTPSDSQSANNNTPPSDTEKAPEKGPEVHTQPQTPPDSEPEDSEPNDWPDEPETDYYETESEYIPRECIVTFVLEGYGDQPNTQIIKEGNLAKEPTVKIDPAIGTFEGAWYTEPIYDTPYKFDFNTPITEDITLYGYVIPNPELPVLMLDAEQISNAAYTNAQDILSADLMVEGKRTFTRLVANENGYGDPYLYVIPTNSNYTLPQYMAISYRTNSVLDGQFFIGSDRGPTGQGDMFSVYWDEGEAWNLLIVDLTTVGVTSIRDNLIGFLRFDFFTSLCFVGDYFDVEYIAFFNSPEYARDYDYAMHKAPTWQEDASIIKHVSFDELFYGDNRTGIFTPGHSAGWDLVANFNDFSVDTLNYWGWVAYCGEFGQFGYQINGGTPVYDEAFAIQTEEGVIHAALGCGADSGQRMNIMISLAGLEGENTVRTLYKSADGVETCLNEFTVILPVKPKDITNTFTSDVHVNDAGINVKDSDLKNYFSFNFPIGSNCLVQADGTYYIDAINEMYADMNGKYFFKVNQLSTQGCGWMFVRGYRVVNSDELIEKFDPSSGIYKINNYYETDGTNWMGGSGTSTGGAGIYARIEAGTLYIVVKYYDANNVTRVGNRSFSLPCNGTKLTMADDGETVSILVDGQTMATIQLEGSTVYKDINVVSPKNGFATRATVTLADGTTEVIENTLVADTCECQIGMVVRAGSLKFDTVEVLPFSYITIPEIRIPFEVPEHYDEAVDLATGHGAPFTSPQEIFGQRFNIGDNFLKNVSINALATYSDGGVNTWSFKVWRWKGDYASTVSAAPLYDFTGENHQDNMTFSLDIPAELGIKGDIYYEIDYLSGNGGFTGWRALDYVAPGVETYVNGNYVGGTYASSIIIGVPIA